MMAAPAGRVALSAFACEFGDRERRPDTIEGFAAICERHGLGSSLATTGCGTFWQMTQPVESYVTRCIARTLAASGVAAEEVDHLVIATMDKTLRHLDQDFARNVLAELGLVNCMPVLISMQQCGSSLAAVDHARRLLADPDVRHVIVAAVDFVPDDADRIRPFALFGDAATSFLMTRVDRGGPGTLALLAYGANMDFAGLVGKDSFDTRKQLAVATLQRALRDAGARLEDVTRCFSTNFFKPVALFNASLCGVHRRQLAIDTLAGRAHCGNCDWVINLVHHQQQTGLTRGKTYMTQAFAPGFFACALLEPVA